MSSNELELKADELNSLNNGTEYVAVPDCGIAELDIETGEFIGWVL